MIKKIKNFLINSWRFRGSLSRYNDFDSSCSLEIFKRSLELLHDGIKKYGNKESTDMVLSKIERVITLLNAVIEDDYYNRTNPGIPKSEFKISDKGGFLLINSSTEQTFKNFGKSLKLQEDEWNELFQILKGNGSDNWDGSDIRTWWD